MRNHNFDSAKVALVGRSGRGKSTFQRQLIRQWPARFKFVFDHKGEFARYLPAFSCETWAQCEAVLKSHGGVVFNPCRAYPGNIRLAFDHFCSWVFDRSSKIRGRKLFAFDECGLLAPKHPAKYAAHGIAKIMDTGREMEIDVCLASQSPVQIGTGIRDQISKWYCFQLATQRAGAPLCDDYGYEWNQIARLERGHFIAYDANDGSFARGQSKPDQK